jgi:hypothetical protein
VAVDRNPASRLLEIEQSLRDDSDSERGSGKTRGFGKSSRYDRYGGALVSKWMFLRSNTTSVNQDGPMQHAARHEESNSR